MDAMACGTGRSGTATRDTAPPGATAPPIGDAAPRRGMLHRIAALAIGAPRRTLALTALVMAVAGIFGAPVAQSLSASGFQDPTSESARAANDPDRQVRPG